MCAGVQVFIYEATVSSLLSCLHAVCLHGSHRWIDMIYFNQYDLFSGYFALRIWLMLTAVKFDSLQSCTDKIDRENHGDRQ